MKTTMARVAATLGVLCMVGATGCKDDPTPVAEAGDAGAPTTVASSAAAATRWPARGVRSVGSALPRAMRPAGQGRRRGMEMHVAYAFEIPWARSRRASTTSDAWW